MNNAKMELATLAGGCFWCTEAVFRRLKGVESVMSGYAGDGKPNPTYEEVSSGTTEYAEAVQITFDPTVISFDKLLDVFWAVHNPTTLNRQGADMGTQYRSAIFYNSDEQKTAAEASIKRLTESKKYSDPVVTKLEKYAAFYAAEEYHRDFYERNRSNGYCSLVIDPKIHKLYKDFKKDLKTEYATES